MQKEAPVLMSWIYPQVQAKIVKLEHVKPTTHKIVNILTNKATSHTMKETKLPEQKSFWRKGFG